MTRYEVGFLAKCAESGVPLSAALPALVKSAAKPTVLGSAARMLWQPLYGSFLRGASNLAGGLNYPVTALDFANAARKQKTMRQIWGEFSGTNFGRSLTGKNVAEARTKFLNSRARPWTPKTEAEIKQLTDAYRQALDDKNIPEIILRGNGLAGSAGGASTLARDFVTSKFRDAIVNKMGPRRAALIREIEGISDPNLLAARQAELNQVNAWFDRVRGIFEDPDAYLDKYLTGKGVIGEKRIGDRINAEYAKGRKVMDKKYIADLKRLLSGGALPAGSDTSTIRGALGPDYEGVEAAMDYLRNARKTRNTRLGTAAGLIGAPVGLYAYSTGVSGPNSAARGGYGNSKDYFGY